MTSNEKVKLFSISNFGMTTLQLMEAIKTVKRFADEKCGVVRLVSCTMTTIVFAVDWEDGVQMIKIENILDTGYVVVNKDNGYFMANAGLYRTEKGAQKECERMTKYYPNRKYRVVKVNLVVSEE